MRRHFGIYRGMFGRMAITTFPAADRTPYEERRPQIRPGDLLLCSGTSAFSRLIQGATNSQWSHVGFLMPIPSIGRVMVLESLESVGVRTVPLSRYLTNYSNTGKAYDGGIVIARHNAFPTDNPVPTNFTRRAVDLFGYPYDNDAIARIAARIAASSIANSLARVFGGQAARLTEMVRDDEYICSEYVQECYRSVNIHIPTNRAGFVSPADIAELPEVTAIAVLQDLPA